MRIQVKDGRVLFNNEEFKNLNIDVQIESDNIMSKIDNNYTFNELLEMTRAKARQAGMNVTLIVEPNE